VILYYVSRESPDFSFVLYIASLMARALTHSIPSNTLEAAVRRHFGLAQAELARYLGVSAGLVAHLEAGRRQASPLLFQRLERLAALLPPPTGAGPVAPVFRAVVVPTAVAPLTPELPPYVVLAPRPVQVRQRQVKSQAAGLRWALHRADKRMGLQSRREWGLALLQTALPTSALPAAEQARLDHWLQVLAADVAATALGPVALTKHALMVVRVLALDAEAATLALLLTAG
jgi:transcriptional regulator with XRE-family HTH domain